MQEHVLPSRIKWRRTNTVRSTALSHFHPRLPPRPLPMDHGYAVDVAHLLFTASADSHDTQRRRRRTGAASAVDEQWNSSRDFGEKQLSNARPYNRVSLNDTRGGDGRTARSRPAEVAFRSTNHFYVIVRRYFTPQLLLLLPRLDHSDSWKTILTLLGVA